MKMGNSNSKNDKHLIISDAQNTERKDEKLIKNDFLNFDLFKLCSTQKWFFMIWDKQSKHQIRTDKRRLIQMMNVRKRWILKFLVQRLTVNFEFDLLHNQE